MSGKGQAVLTSRIQSKRKSNAPAFAKAAWFEQLDSHKLLKARRKSIKNVSQVISRVSVSISFTTTELFTLGILQLVDIRQQEKQECANHRSGYRPFEMLLCSLSLPFKTLQSENPPPSSLSLHIQDLARWLVHHLPTMSEEHRTLTVAEGELVVTVQKLNHSKSPYFPNLCSVHDALEADGLKSPLSWSPPIQADWNPRRASP